MQNRGAKPRSGIRDKGALRCPSGARSRSIQLVERVDTPIRLRTGRNIGLRNRASVLQADWQRSRLHCFDTWATAVSPICDDQQDTYARAVHDASDCINETAAADLGTRTRVYGCASCTTRRTAGRSEHAEKCRRVAAHHAVLERKPETQKRMGAGQVCRNGL